MPRTRVGQKNLVFGKEDSSRKLGRLTTLALLAFYEKQPFTPDLFCIILEQYGIGGPRNPDGGRTPTERGPPRL